VDFLLEPRSAAVLAAAPTLRCFRAPDLPTAAVGEQHLYLHQQDGLVHVEVDEVVELDVPRLAVTRSRTWAHEVLARYTCEESALGGTDHVLETWTTVPAREAASLQARFEEQVWTTVRRLKEALECGRHPLEDLDPLPPPAAAPYDGARTRLHVSRSGIVACSPDTVMGFLLAPVSAVMVGPHTVRCFRAPDTPVGEVGEQHVAISEEDGRLHVEVDEVVELDFPRVAVTRNLTTPGDIRVRYTCDQRPDGGTDYRQEVSIDVSPGQERVLRPLFEAETDRAVARITEVLESGAWVPDQDPP
jgi:hypothetical protein